MNQYSIQKRTGIGLFREGSEIVGTSGVEYIGDLGHGVRLYSVDGAEVLIRKYPDGDEPLFDCGICRCDLCGHIAAVMISAPEELPEPYGDEEGFDKIGDIIDMISELEGFDADMFGSGDFTAIRGSIIETIGFIVGCTDDPDRALQLFDDLETALSGIYFPGIDEVIEQVSVHAYVALLNSSPDSISEYVVNHISDTALITELAEDIGRERFAEIYRIVKDRKPKDATSFRRMMLFAEDFDGYLASSLRRSEDAMTIAEVMFKRGDPEGARRYAEMADARDLTRRFDSTYITLLESLGLKDKAFDVLYEFFTGFHDFGFVKDMYRLDPERTVSVTRDFMKRSRYPLGTSDLSQIARYGGAEDVAEYLSKKGLPNILTELAYSRKRGSELESLCRSLADGRQFDASAGIARSAIEDTLEKRYNHAYEGAAHLLRMMDSYEDFEYLFPPQSAYVNNLRERYPTMKKFWSTYDSIPLKKKRKKGSLSV